MSRLTELLKQVEQQSPELAADLEREVKAIAGRRAFGLNFERHTPETVELPGRPVRAGDKVRVLPPRDEPKAKANSAIWRVTAVKKGVATLTGDGEQEAMSDVEDLVVVAEFRDPIYPGLVSTGKVERGGADKPFHSVICAENFHALQTLLYTHEGKIDAIYIDPPYNTGAKDWKYNNDYVDGEDAYRHSKWLAMMERRLKLAKRLLNPEDSVLIVTIDEKEYLRLGLLLEQVFPERKTQMVSLVVNPRGIVRDNEFSRSNEFAFFLWAPRTRLIPLEVEQSEGEPIAWETMRRRSLAGARGRKGPGACGPNQFYAIHVDQATGKIIGRGEPLPLDARADEYQAPTGCVAVFPARRDGTEMNWSLTDAAFDDRWRRGFVRAGGATPEHPQKYVIQYVLSGVIRDIDEGRARIEGQSADGSVIASYETRKTIMAHTQWDRPAHNAQQHGTGLLKNVLPDRRFPFAKSLYAVEDTLRFFVAGRPDATILDFFAGSGTTAHAVMRLNKQDGGRRRCISVTNNEVSADEQKRLRKEGLRAGDPEWEQLGICDHITKPRIEAAITGRTPLGEPIKGAYKFTDEFPMADGFEENAEFFTLTYEAPRAVAHNRAFERIAPLLWLRAGSEGRRIDTITGAFDVADTYGVLWDLDHAEAFIEVLAANESSRLAYIVTDDDRAFQAVCAGLPGHCEPVRLYESYLTNFTLSAGDNAA